MPEDVAGVTGPHGASVAQVAAKELSSVRNWADRYQICFHGRHKPPSAALLYVYMDGIVWYTVHCTLTHSKKY